METIGDKIKRLRKSKGLSLKDLVKILNVSGKDFSDTALSKIETGLTKNITVALGKELAKALDISFNELFEIESSNGNAEIIKKLNTDIEGLKKQMEDKTLLIETLKNEREHIRWHILSEIVINYMYHSGITSRIASKINDKEINDEEIKNLLVKMRIFITTTLDRNKEFYSKTGLITKEDLDSFIDKFGSTINNEFLTYQQSGSETNNTFSITFPFSFDVSE